MEITVFFMLPLALLALALVIFLITMFVKLMILVFRALRKYVNSGPQRQEEEILRRSLGEVLKDHRTRQAVSKWENGTADPSTSNLLKLAKLYGITPEELIRAVQPQRE